MALTDHGFCYIRNNGSRIANKPRSRFKQNPLWRRSGESSTYWELTGRWFGYWRDLHFAYHFKVHYCRGARSERVGLSLWLHLLPLWSSWRLRCGYHALQCTRRWASSLFFSLFRSLMIYCCALRSISHSNGGHLKSSSLSYYNSLTIHSYLFLNQLLLISGI